MGNMKKRDFDYYLTNLDWDDGTAIDREITQFTRNDVFEHNYERPGFYSIKGLVFKYTEQGVEALGETHSPVPNMKKVWKENHNGTYFDGHPNQGETYHFVETKKSINQLSSSMSTIKKRPQQAGGEGSFDDYMAEKYTITEMYKSYTPTFIGDDHSPANMYGLTIPITYQNTVIALMEHRNEESDNTILPGISINIPLTLDQSKINYLNYSFEINLPNPNSWGAIKSAHPDAIKGDYPNAAPTNYVIRERAYPPNYTGAVDWGAFHQDYRIVQGMGGSSRFPGRDNLPTQGWQRIQGTIFVQERSEWDSDGLRIPEVISGDERHGWTGKLEDIINMRIEIYPTSRNGTPQGWLAGNGEGSSDVSNSDHMEFIAIRNLSFKTPNTENIIRPVEWQRFHSNVVVNPRDDYDSPLYEENDFALIGGLSKESTHFKTLSSMLAFDLDAQEYKSAVKPDYNQYDLLAMYDTFAKYDDKLYNRYLEPYTKQINEDYAPYWNNASYGSGSLYNKPIITTGMFDKSFHGVFKDTEIIDLDVATTKMYKGVKPMWQQLGFDNPEYDNPSLVGYWKNIIPKEYKLDDREGITVQEYQGHYFQKGSLTPRIPREEYVFISGSNQEWIGGYYWPVLPKFNHVGIFEEDVNTSLYGDESKALMTQISDSDLNLTFNLNFNVDEVEELQDMTNINHIRYSVDSVLGLDDTNRLDKVNEDITDTIEKDIRGQAF